MGTDQPSAATRSPLADRGHVLVAGEAVVDDSGQRPDLKADVLVRDRIVTQTDMCIIAPADAEVIDATDKRVTQGFFDQAGYGTVLRATV